MNPSFAGIALRLDVVYASHVAENTQTKAVHGLKVQSVGGGGGLGARKSPAARPRAIVGLKEWDSPRNCKFCRLSFQPKVKSAKRQEFCCPSHRKRYHETGRMPFYKLMDRIEAIVEREVSVLRLRLDAVENSLREVQDGRNDVA